MSTPNSAAKREYLLPPCFPEMENRAGKQIPHADDPSKLLVLFGKNGAGEGIRTLDPNLGKVVLYP